MANILVLLYALVSTCLILTAPIVGELFSNVAGITDGTISKNSQKEKETLEQLQSIAVQLLSAEEKCKSTTTAQPIEALLPYTQETSSATTAARTTKGQTLTTKEIPRTTTAPLTPKTLLSTAQQTSRATTVAWTTAEQSLDRINSTGTQVSWKGCLTEGINSLLINKKLIEVYCEVNGNDSWMVFQKRYSGEVDFYLDWEAYKTGFGNLSGEFWLGLENLYVITNSGSYKLRVDLEDWVGNTGYGEYSTFSVGNSATNYRLRVGGYIGTAGDALAYHNGQQFSTKDRDNDHQSNENCAEAYHGAWWYNSCYESNLNGKYIRNEGYRQLYDGMRWHRWRGTSSYSMKKATMKIQPI